MRKNKMLRIMILSAFLFGIVVFSDPTILNDANVDILNQDLQSSTDLELDWQYQRIVSISPGTPVSNYQLRIDLSSSNFDYENAKSDGSDLRFSDINGNNLSYWIEEWNYGGNSIIWVKVPTSGTEEIKMLYGNAAASSASNGTETFVFFDDFLGSSLNPSVWSTEVGTYCGITVSGGTLYLYSQAPSYAFGLAEVGFSDHELDQGVPYSDSWTNGHANLGFDLDGVWSKIEVKYRGEDDAPIYIDDVYANNDSSDKTGPLPIQFYAASVYSGPGSPWAAWAQTIDTSYGVEGMAMRFKAYTEETSICEVEVDWVFVRNYGSIEVDVSISLCPEWDYVTPVLIEPATPISDYQIRINLSSSNFDYSHADTNGDDIRFADLSGNLLNYWIEEWNYGGESIIWIKVALSGTEKINMFYGNDAATSESNGTETFVFFDDFLGSSLNPSVWSTEVGTYCGITVSGGTLYLYSQAPSYAFGLAEVGFSDHELDQGVPYSDSWTNGHANLGFDLDGVWSKIEVKYRGEDDAPIYIDDVYANNDSSDKTGPLPIQFYAASVYSGPGSPWAAWAQTIDTSYGVEGMAMRFKAYTEETSICEVEVDWVFVRNYSSIEVDTTLETEGSYFMEYMKSISIDPGTPVDDYQLRINLSATNFDYTHADLNGDDLRFRDPAGNNLSYWIEEWNYKGDSIVWVEIPSSGTEEIHMLYGDGSASAASNGTETFVFFDDFLGSSLNPSVWSTEVGTYCGITVSGGTLYLYSQAPSYAFGLAEVGFSDHELDQGVPYSDSWTNGHANLGFDLDGVWSKIEVKYRGEDDAPIYIDDVYANNDSSDKTGPLPIQFYAASVYSGPGSPWAAWAQTIDTSYGVEGMAMRFKAYTEETSICEVEVDWVFIRNYGSIEVEVTLGEEEPCIDNVTLSTITSPDLNGSYSIDWSENEEANAYLLYRDISDFSSVDGLTPIYNGTDSNYTETGITPGAYYYAVKAYNRIAESLLSARKSVNVEYPTDQPEINTITTPDLDGSYLVDWDSVDYADTYYLFRDTSDFSNVDGMTPIYMGSDTEYSQVDMVADEYYYAVIAGNGLKNTTLSDRVSVSVEYPTAEPEIDAITTPDLDGSYDVEWDAVQYATIYYLYRSTSDFSDVDGMTPIYVGSNTEYTETDMDVDEFFYAIIAGNGEINTSLSDCISVSVEYPTVIPTIDSIDSPDTDGNYSVEWNDITYADRYYLFREESDFTSIDGLIPIYSGSDSNFTEVDVFPGEYYYAVIAGNGEVNTSLSDRVMVEVDYPIDTPILEELPEYSYNGTVFLSWTDDNETALTYSLYRSDSEFTTTDGLTAIFSGYKMNYTDVGLAPGTYYYAVTASNGIVTTDLSNQRSIIVAFYNGSTFTLVGTTQYVEIVDGGGVPILGIGLNPDDEVEISVTVYDINIAVGDSVQLLRKYELNLISGAFYDRCTIRFYYNDQDLTPEAEESLTAFQQEGEEWTSLLGTTVYADDDYVFKSISEFGVYGLGIDSSSPDPPGLFENPFFLSLMAIALISIIGSILYIIWKKK